MLALQGQYKFPFFSTLETLAFMDSVTVLEIAKMAIYVLLRISLPLMLVALAVGLLISFFQAITQIQEMTLTFVPKIIAIFVSMLIFLPFMGAELNTFTEFITERIIEVGHDNKEITP